MTYYTHIDTPAGTLLLVGNENTLHGVYWKTFARTPTIPADWIENSQVFTEVTNQLVEYFIGDRATFDVSCALQGTAFQEQVWRELNTIPFGSTSSYKAIANAIDRPKAVRAIGTAVGSNPLAIIIPCHRVLTSSNELGGYSGGLAAKRILLKKEKIDWKEV